MTDRYNVTDITPVFDIRCEIKVTMVEMRDGVKLHTMIYFPEEFSGKAPVLLFRTPYTRTTCFELPSGDCLERNTVYIVQASRGTGWSGGGIFDPAEYPQYEISDAEDTFNWLAQQPFFNGSCAMIGGSYPGFLQWAAAFTAHPALVGVTPQVAPVYGCCTSARKGGGNALNIATHWVLSMYHRRKFGYAGVPDYDQMKVDWHLPPDQTAGFAGYPENVSLDKFMAGANDPVRSVKSNVNGFCRITVPAFITGGWFDVFKEETIQSFRLMKESAATDNARRFTRLIIGPWEHAGLVNPDIFGAENDYRDLLTRRREFIFGLLADKNRDPIPQAPAVQYFMLGENRWCSAADWPPPEMRYTRMFLHGNGLIDRQISGVSGERSYISDPSDPVLNNNGKPECIGCFDLRETESRSDVLTYTSDILTQDIRIAGEVKLSFHAAVEAPDTDFFATLTEVLPDGSSMLRTSGMIRARFRDGGSGSLLECGKVYAYELSLGNVAACFRKGHKLRLVIAGQNFPKFDRNAQSGKAIFSDTELFAARCTVIHDAGHPAVLHLPELA